MAQMIYNSDKHAYIGERFEVGEDIVQEAFDAALFGDDSDRDTDTRVAAAWQVAVNEDTYTEDMEGVTVIGTSERP